MWEFSSPVDFHCATNSFCARLPITVVSPIATGMVINATIARTGEMTNIMTVTPTTVSNEVSSWLSVCCSDWATLSMSLVTRLSSSPRVCRSKYDRGIRLILASTPSRSRRTERCTAPFSR